MKLKMDWSQYNKRQKKLAKAILKMNKRSVRIILFGVMYRCLDWPPPPKRKGKHDDKD